jgi:nucleoside-diphosphate-sugar epimerase
VDITDREALVDYVARLRPDLVFHLAAQRDPGLAERAVRRTVRTNVLGTRNVVEAAAGVDAQLVYASTGKALRPYTSDVYAASKRAGEWVVGDAAARGRLSCSAARFTHVVDNAIVLDRFHRWCAAGEPVRIHAVETRFYVQSALESAQLLLVAALAPRDDQLRVYAISDLGWPVGVLDIALGVLARHGRPVPLYVAGHEPGYEQRPYPGLFDPAYSGDVSPLFNAMEAPRVCGSPSRQVGVSTHRVRPDATVQRHIELLERLCAEAGDAEVRSAFNGLAWLMLDAACCVTPQAQLRRIARITTPHRDAMSAEHLRMDDKVRRWAGIARPDPPRQRATAG